MGIITYSPTVAHFFGEDEDESLVPSKRLANPPELIKVFPGVGRGGKKPPDVCSCRLVTHLYE